MRKILNLLLIFFYFTFEAETNSPRVKKQKTRKTTTASTQEYPVLFRDHIYRNLSENGRDLFYALEVHPSCIAKKGECIQRAKCIDRKMLYLSRLCYQHDLVCCYDDTLKFPSISEYSNETTT